MPSSVLFCALEQSHSLILALRQPPLVAKAQEEVFLRLLRDYLCFVGFGGFWCRNYSKNQSFVRVYLVGSDGWCALTFSIALLG